MLHPLLLWFLPLAAVPLLLHLITLYRLRTVELSTFRFLMDSYIQQRRRMKLLEWLLMLLRTGFVALIVLHAGPAHHREIRLSVRRHQRTRRRLDRRRRGDLRAANGRQLGAQTGQRSGRRGGQKLAPADYVTLIRAGSQPGLLYRGYLTDKKELLEKIDAIKPDIAAPDLAAALAEGLSTAAHGPRVMYVISDLQRRSWAPLADHPVVRQLGRDVQLVVMNVGSDRSRCKTWPCWASRRGRSDRSSICRCCSPPKSPPASAISRSAPGSASCWKIRSSGN